MHPSRTPSPPRGFALVPLTLTLAGWGFALAACVPDTFTYGAGGSGGAGGASSTGGAGGGDAVCGDGEVQAGEDCDLGLANSDDHVDVSLTDDDDSRGCSTSCRHVVQWSQVIGNGAIDRQSVVLGVAVSETNVFVGGVVDDPNPLDFVGVRFGGRRLYTRLSPTDATQLTTIPIVDRDVDGGGFEVDGNAIFALVPGTTPDEVYALESVHDSGVRLETYVRMRSNDAQVWDSPGVARAESAFAALGPRDTQGRVLAVGPDFANTPELSRVSPDGQSLEQASLDLPLGWSGSGPASVTPVSDGGAIATWEGWAVRFGGNGEGILFSEDLGANLGLDLDITGLCALGDDRFAMSGWALVDGGLDGIVLVVDDQLGVLGQAVFDGELGGADLFRGIACDGTGSVVVVGEESTLPDAATSPQTSTHSRFLTRRYDVSPSGEPSVRWTRTYASPVASTDPSFAGNDGFAVAIGPDGFVYVAGRKQVSQSLATAWVRKYAP